MALFGKTDKANTTLYSKEKYNITGKRALEEPRYLFITASYIDGWVKPYCYFPEFDKNLEPDFYQHMALIGYANKVLQGDPNGGNSKKAFVGECVISGFSTTRKGVLNDLEYKPTSNGSNDMVMLHFEISGINCKDRVNRPLRAYLTIMIDAADYANLDIKEFVGRVQNDIKTKEAAGSTPLEIAYDYPVQWFIKDAKDKIKFASFPNKGFLPPKNIPYNKAIKIKDGGSVVGKKKINNIPEGLPNGYNINWIQNGKPLIDSSTSTKPIEKKSITTKTAIQKPTPSTSSNNSDYVWDPKTNGYVKKTASLIKAKEIELAAIKRQINALTKNAKELEAELDELKANQSSSLGRK